jgi:elongator complex protein 5
LTLLKYLATTIITTHSLHHILARAAARARSHVEPCFGLEEGIEGVIQGVGSNGKEGVVLELEHRRKSGRGVREWYFLPLSNQLPGGGKDKEAVMLLEDHPEYAKLSSTNDAETDAEVDTGATFEMGLTDRQKADREGVVLPYFDAQRGDGGGEGGRILYDMGSEDDFDEEEDEI